MAGGDGRVYIGSIYYNISEEDIRAIFGAFGSIKVCEREIVVRGGGVDSGLTWLGWVWGGTSPVS